MTHDLFIDGKVVDIDDNTNITLKYNSNIFTDISKIVSNNSYTIKLPNTVRNQGVIEHADLPACKSTFPRFQHVGRYFRNGVEIIPKSLVSLLTTGESIEMAMYWGNITNMANIADKGLNDLSYDFNYKDINNYYPDKEPFAYAWSKEMVEKYPNIFLKGINYGFRSDETEVSYHPVVSVKWILDRIAKDAGVEFDYNNDMGVAISKLFVPLLTRNDSKAYAQYDAAKGSIVGQVYDERKKKNCFILDFNNFDPRYFLVHRTSDNKNVGVESLLNNLKASVSGNLEVNLSGTNKPDDIKLIVYYYGYSMYGNNDYSTILEVKPFSIVDNNGSYSVTFDFSTIETEELKYPIRFGFDNYGSCSVDSVDGNIQIEGVKDEITLSKKEGSNKEQLFWIIPNLPNIKQIDFLKAICAMLCCFAVEKGTNKIGFVSVKDIIDSIPVAYDWTKRVVASYKSNKPMQMEYSIDGFAQKNNVCYKQDDSVRGNYNGIIQIDDKTLDYESDIITLPFAGTDMVNDIPSIPLYTYKDGKLETNKVEPRILLDNTGGITFRGLEWECLIDKYYKQYVNTISSPIIITEKITINDIDLKNLDITRPIYLAQYGRYYAIISITAESTGICKCKLLQLNL